MTIEQLIEGRIQQARSKQATNRHCAEKTKCMNERIKNMAEAARQQAILDEYEILKQQIKEQQ